MVAGKTVEYYTLGGGGGGEGEGISVFRQSLVVLPQTSLLH